MRKRTGIVLISVISVMMAILLSSGSVLAETAETPELDVIGEEIRDRIKDRKEELEATRENPELIEEIKKMPLEEKVHVMGRAVDFEEYGQPPIIRDNRTLVPLRTISDYLGAEIDWDGETRKITIEYDDTTIELIIGENEVEINGQSQELEVPAQITEKERTVVPLRFISEVMGISVDYREETGEIDLGLDLLDELDIEELESPLEVVNSFWQHYKEGRKQDAREKLIDTDAMDIADIASDLEELEGLDEDEVAVLDRFDIKALDYQIENDTALVDIELTKPDFAKAIDLYYEKAIERAAEYSEEDLTEREIGEKIFEEADEIMLDSIQQVEQITHLERVELQKQDGEWKINEWLLENMESRWEDLRDQYF